MSYCPRPSKVNKTAYSGAGKLTVNPPPQRTEACNTAAVSSSSTQSTSTSTQTVVQGPMGPQGPAGKDGLNGLGFLNRNEWGTGASYQAADPASEDNAKRVSDVVTHHGQTYVCIKDHTADGSNEPQLDSFTGPTNWQEYWLLWAKKGDAGLNATEKSWFQRLEDAWDWVKNASLEDWLTLAAKGVGIAIAGALVVKALVPDVDSDAHADQRFDGTPGYNGTYTPPKLKDFIQSACDFAGIDCDVSLIPDEEIIEMTLNSSGSTIEMLENLALAFSLDTVCTPGLIKFVPKKTVPDVTITLDDMGFTDGESVVPPPYTAKRFQGIDLPQKVSISYYARDYEYNTFTQSYELFGYPEGQIVELSVPVCLEHERAKRICESFIVNAHLERMNYKFSTSLKYAAVEPADMLDTPMGLLRVLRVDEASDGILQFECCDAGTEEAYSASNAGVQYPPEVNNTVTEIGQSRAHWIDMNNLNDSDTKVRIYAAVHGFGRKGWPGAAIMESTDGGNSYTELVRVFEESTVGLVATPVANHAYHTWDNDTTIQVQLKTGSLSSKPDIAVLNGENWALVGREIIGFANATMVSPGVWNLTRLLRGRQGTEVYVGSHEADELFVLLDGAPVELEFNPRMSTRKLKCVTLGSSAAVMPEENVQVLSNNLRPWPVYAAKVEAQAGGSWKITWKGRVRFNNEMQDFTTTNNDETFGGYGIAILDASDNVLKSYTTTSEEYILSTEQQIADLGGLQTSLKVSIVPLDKNYGGGYPTVVNS